MGFRKGEDGEAFGQVLLGLGSELGLAFRVGFHEIIEALLGVENDLDVRGDLAFEMLFGEVFLGVSLEVELAALPRSAV